MSTKLTPNNNVKSSVDDTEWAGPPPLRRGGRPPSKRWTDIAASCRENPGEWLKVHDAPKGVAFRIRRGLLAAFEDGVWEAAQAKCDVSDCWDVYVRYLDA